MEGLYIVLCLITFILTIVILVYFFQACNNIKKITLDTACIKKKLYSSETALKPIQDEVKKEKKEAGVSKEIENREEIEEKEKYANKIFLIVVAIIIFFVLLICILT